MKIFFGTTFIKKESLKEAGINYPIKLDYYKIINEQEIIKNEKSKFGINIVKTEYIGDKVNIENESIQYLSDSEENIESLLQILKKYEVTPIEVNDIVDDFFKKMILI